jgi:hypothetical protein
MTKEQLADVNRKVDRSDPAKISDPTVKMNKPHPLDKKIAAAEASVSRAKAARQRKGERTQSLAESRAHGKLTELRSQKARQPRALPDSLQTRTKNSDAIQSLYGKIEKVQKAMEAGSVSKQHGEAEMTRHLDQIVFLRRQDNS